jgi:hypothetical protein
MARSFGVPIALPADAASPLHAVTKQQMDAADATKAASSHTHIESDVTSLVSDLALKAPLAAPQFTGVANFGGAVTRTVNTLTDASTVTVNAALGNFQRLVLTSGVGATRAMGTPSNPVDGMLLMFAIKQDSVGSRLVTWPGIFTFGTDVISPVLSTGANKVDYVGFIYSGSGTVWHCIAVARGY